MLLKKLNIRTNQCRVCSQIIVKNSILAYIRDFTICERCNKELQSFKCFDFSNKKKNKCIYMYEGKIRELLLQFKAMNDYALAPIFLENDLSRLKKFYKGYTLIPVPSYWEDDEKRGFNHVEAIFASLELPMAKIIYKSEKWKQSDLSYESRKEIQNVLSIKLPKHFNRKKNYVLVDDIYTSGSTISACLRLLKLQKIERVKVLVLSKVMSNYRGI